MHVARPSKKLFLMTPHTQLTLQTKISAKARNHTSKNNSRNKMAPLKCLAREYPIIDSNFQHFCASHGIFSVEDFLLHDLDVLVGSTERESTSQRLKQGINQVLSIIDAQRQPCMNGMELLEDVQRNKHVLSTGCEGIDLLLGGLREGHITEVAGPSSSGKTQICLQAAANVSEKHAGGVIYLDTGNSFSPHRIAQFVDQIANTSPKEDKGHILKNVMDGILCSSVFDIFAMLDVLQQLESKLRFMRTKMSTRGKRAHLLIIDSISSLITPILGGNVSHGRALMISAGYLLKKLAREHSLAVLVINHMVGGEGGNQKPALGESWKSIPHVRLLLTRDRGSNNCNVAIIRHPSMASGKAVKFMAHD